MTTAYELLQEARDWISGERVDFNDALLDRIDAYLAQPAPEPVAWANLRDDGTIVALSQHPEDIARWLRPVPLYAAQPEPAAKRRPCRSPYCECEEGCCTHPGCYDARGETI